MKSTDARPKTEEACFFENLQAFACRENRPYAAFRLPNKNYYEFFCGKPETLQHLEPTFTDLPKGFVFAPFESAEKVFYFESDFEILFDEHQIVMSGNFSEEKISETSGIKKKYYTKNHAAQKNADYRDIVSRAVEEIAAGKMTKIVLSRFDERPLPPDFSLHKAFKNLLALYPAAFVCLLSTPENGTWLCATPELLVSHDENDIFSTVALAGTQIYTGTSLKEFAWRDKEIEEQALVSRYIINCFKKIRLREYEEIGPRTFNAGNLVHLCSHFSVNTKNTCFPDLISVMCRLLHPTSAVCGMPKDEAKLFIKAHENYDRELYSGFLGAIYGQNRLSLFVHLRCMQVFENEARLYAGAGITADSDPEKEWLETENKLKTVGKIFL